MYCQINGYEISAKKLKSFTSNFYDFWQLPMEAHVS